MEAVITLDSHLRAAAADYPRITQRLPLQGKAPASPGSHPTCSLAANYKAAASYSSRISEFTRCSCRL